MTVCIPVVPGPDADEDPGLRFSPETEALSVLGFGDYSVIAELWGQLHGEMDAAGLEPAGPGRLVAPYVGAHIRPDEFCYECIVPIGAQPRRALEAAGFLYHSAEFLNIGI